MDFLEQKIAGARADYASIHYRGAALDPARLERPSAGFFPGFTWRPVLALAALLAVLLALLPDTPGPDPAPPASRVAAAPALGSPMDTLNAARRAIAAVPVAPRRPSDGLFRLPAPPQRPSRFSEVRGPELG